MIIDIHTHAWPEKVSQKARENLESVFKVPFVGDPTVSTLLRYMDKNNISVSVICAVATRPEQVPSINDWLFSVRGERIRAFCALHPEYASWKEELVRIKEKADGVKLQPEFQDFYVDDKKVYPVYEMMEALQLPVLFHCGEELSGTMLVRSSAGRILKVKKDFPRLTIIAAHYGGFRLWEEVEKYLIGTDVFLDTAFFFGFLPREKTIQMLLEHRSDRLLFGTDFPLVDQKKDLDYLAGLEIPDDLKERILYRNARELLGI
jgi:predicted TIM-barrel fold metal-dependent hydrolase